jgi:hypothetical protein
MNVVSGVSTPLSVPAMETLHGEFAIALSADYNLNSACLKIGKPNPLIRGSR